MRGTHPFTHIPSHTHWLFFLELSCCQDLSLHLEFLLTWKVHHVHSTNPVIPTCILGKIRQHRLPTLSWLPSDIVTSVVCQPAPNYELTWHGDHVFLFILSFADLTTVPVTWQVHPALHCLVQSRGKGCARHCGLTTQKPFITFSSGLLQLGRCKQILSFPSCSYSEGSPRETVLANVI